MKSNGYSAIGGIFEYLNSDCGYLQWSQYLIEKLKDCGAGLCGLDAGCGNGYFTRALSRAGYDMTGMDISPEALSKAELLSAEEGINARYILGDISTFGLPKRADFITAVNDCLNYIPAGRLKKTFSNVASNLKKGGTFLFDVSSEQKLRTEVGNSTIVKDLEEATLIWYNTLFDDRVEMELTLFKRRKDGTYARSDEVQTQYIHSENAILDALSAAGFSARAEGHLGGEKTERINFICKKL